MTDLHHIDFAQIIAELVAAGVSHYKISLMMRRQLNQVQRWANMQKPSEPKHYEGQMLLMIHAEYVRVVTNVTSSPPSATANR